MNAAQVLDDYLESLDYPTEEIRRRIARITELGVQFEEMRKSLFKKRNLCLRAEDKGLDAQLKATLLRRTERDGPKLRAVLEEKLSLERRLLQIVEGHLSRLDSRMRSLGIIPDVEHLKRKKLLVDSVPEASSHHHDASKRSLPGRQKFPWLSLKSK